MFSPPPGLIYCLLVSQSRNEGIRRPTSAFACFSIITEWRYEWIVLRGGRTWCFGRRQLPTVAESEPYSEPHTSLHSASPTTLHGLHYSRALPTPTRYRQLPTSTSVGLLLLYLTFSTYDLNTCIPTLHAFPISTNVPHYTAYAHQLLRTQAAGHLYQCSRPSTQ